MFNVFKSDKPGSADDEASLSLWVASRFPRCTLLAYSVRHDAVNRLSRTH